MTRISKIVKELVKATTQLEKQKGYAQASTLLRLNEYITKNEPYLEKKARGMFMQKSSRIRAIRLQLIDTE